MSEEIEKLTRIAEAAYRWHHRYCDGAKDEAILWRELDEALQAWRPYGLAEPPAQGRPV